MLLYPMNALATDQAHRINDYLQQPEPREVTATLLTQALDLLSGGPRTLDEMLELLPRLGAYTRSCVGNGKCAATGL
ncbi:hypothetical protein [Sphaerisporangium sp. NPDC051011]|uniref:hypothetical protein n=1 Tax=Sphaerisporangium sp. NPDC051011 TaxID=3155792 RepID=UPI0033DCF644